MICIPQNCLINQGGKLLSESLVCQEEHNNNNITKNTDLLTNVNTPKATRNTEKLNPAYAEAKRSTAFNLICSKHARPNTQTHTRKFMCEITFGVYHYIYGKEQDRPAQ